VFPRSGARYDPSAAGQCIDGVKQSIAACKELVSTDICQRVFTGTRAVGEPCQVSLECGAPPGATAECTFDMREPGWVWLTT
jgi:hypothetical protein